MNIVEVVYYVHKNGKSPLKEWLGKLDLSSRVIVIRYIQRVANGSYSNIKSLGDKSTQTRDIKKAKKLWRDHGK